MHYHFAFCFLIFVFITLPYISSLMEILLHIAVILICCVALGKGAAWLVDSAARIAKHMGISELVIGLTVVAFGTSAPEFAVTINAALRGHEGVSIGNVVGSNIFNIGFILGGCALVGPIKTRPALVWRDGLILLVVTGGLMTALAINKQLDRAEGLLMFLGLIAYLIYLLCKRQAVMDEEIPTGKATGKDGFFLLIGLALIVGGGHFLVESSVFLAQKIGLSEWVIGVTIVAAGTSVPEFAISLVALIKKHHGISAGNLVGSNIFNTLGVLGVAGAIQLPDQPLTVETSALWSVLMLIGLTALVLIFMRTGWKLTRKEGWILLIVSLAIWIYVFAAANPAS
jgi:cation:H+ antiporter